jgi:hypothetical protein
LLEIGWCSLWKKEHAPAMHRALPFVNPTKQRNDTNYSNMLQAAPYFLTNL